MVVIRVYGIYIPTWYIIFYCTLRRHNNNNNIIRHQTGAANRYTTAHNIHTGPRKLWRSLFENSVRLLCILFTAESRSLLDRSRVIVAGTRDFSAGRLVADSAPQSLSRAQNTDCRRRRAAAVSSPLYYFFFIYNRELFTPQLYHVLLVVRYIYFYNNTRAKKHKSIDILSYNTIILWTVKSGVFISKTRETIGLAEFCRYTR